MRKMDFSLGDALLPLTYVANYAFRKSATDLNKYYINHQLTLSDPLGKIHAKLSEYFTRRGMHDRNWTGLTTSGLIVTGGGTSEAYEMIVRALANDVKEREKQTGQVLKPVIVMPVPTYGYFFNNAERYGIEIVKVERDLKNGGRLDPDELLKCLRSLNGEGKRVVAYYDSNPNNPTGLIRNEVETRDIARIIDALSRYYEGQDEDWLKDNNKRFRHKGLTSRVKIIDDMIYDGLEYRGQEKPYSFAQIKDRDLDVFPDTFTLFGTSKAGLATLRVGVMIGAKDTLHDVRETQKYSSYFPPMTSYHASLAYFATDKRYVAKREAHLAELNDAHEIRGKLMKCLINGYAYTPEVSRDDFLALTKIVMEEKSLSSRAAGSLLRKGIQGINVITTPQAGFFHLIDFGDLRKVTYNDVILKRNIGYLSDRDYRDHASNGGLKEFEGHKIEHICDVQELVDLSFAVSSWMGLDSKDMIVRTSFAKPFSDIIEMTDRLRLLSKALYTPRMPEPSFAETGPGMK